MYHMIVLYQYLPNGISKYGKNLDLLSEIL